MKLPEQNVFLYRIRMIYQNTTHVLWTINYYFSGKNNIVVLLSGGKVYGPIYTTFTSHL